MSEVQCPLLNRPEVNCLVKQKGDPQWNMHGRDDYSCNYCTSLAYINCLDFLEYVRKVSITKGTVLIVDDEKGFVDVLSRFLTQRGYTVVTALDGQKAIALIEQMHPIMLLLDMNIPQVNGIEVLGFIKEKYASTKVVVITGYQKEYKKELEKFSVEALFDKPVRLEILKQCIEDLLAKELIGTVAVQEHTSSSPASLHGKALFFVLEEKTQFQIAKHAFIYECLKKELAQKGQFSCECFLQKAMNEEELCLVFEQCAPDIILVDYDDVQDLRFQKIMEQLHKAHYTVNQGIMITFRGYAVKSEGSVLNKEELGGLWGASIPHVFDQLRLMIYQHTGKGEGRYDATTKNSCS